MSKMMGPAIGEFISTPKVPETPTPSTPTSASTNSVSWLKNYKMPKIEFDEEFYSSFNDPEERERVRSMVNKMNQQADELNKKVAAMGN